MDRDDAIRKLVQVFRTYGYEGATLSRIAEATTLGRASLYHHFPGGKKEMAEAVSAYVNTQLEATILQPLRSQGEPSDRLQAMIAAFSEFYDHGRNACLLPIFSMTYSDDLFQGQVQQAFQHWIGSVQAVLQEAGFTPIEAEQRAQEAVVQIQGALVVARGLQQTEPFERVLAQLPERLLAPKLVA
ncbi:MAG: TetR/AcrR family transcriptional regulator [Cyanobacteria bacterium P01_H01_bin.121]